jgi:hypothetical protein
MGRRVPRVAQHRRCGEVVTQLPPFVAAMADELRRLPCRDHKAAHCPKCSPLAQYDAYVALEKARAAIVQEPRRQEAET